ncbi:Transitional endoplasmic reticulum ATPase TER94-like Protein [Tribolium castaneum]|uniref:Peroxisomal ATPase PEX6 n=1 Tax=Tribolium castaneum TaxID=7070 RepID=D6WES7_TRICA|nr:Transitional endoplasmic reticulum ATPase TER94-like Protein [Tribolium castaneum]
MSKQKDLRFLVYLAKIAYPRHNSYCFIIYMIVNYCDILKQQQIFTLRGVSSEFLNNFVGGTVLDIDNTIVANDNVEQTCIKYVVVKDTTRKVNLITKKFDTKFVALLSYNLLYNLKGAITCSFKNCQGNLQFADEVELSLVNSAYTYLADLRRAVFPFMKQKKNKFLPVFLLEGRRGSGKSLLVKCLASTQGMHLYTISNFDVTATTYAQNETKLRNSFFAAKMAAPSILQIKNFENFGKNNEGQYDERLISYFTTEVKTLFESNSFPLILICCSSDKNIPIELKRTFLKTFEIKAPNDQEREKILNWILKSQDVTTDIDMSEIANKTHGFLFEDLQTLVHYAMTDFTNEKKSAERCVVSQDYFFRALDLMQSNYSESLGAPRVPQVKWSDVGGLTEVKEEIIKTIKLPLKHSELLKTTGLKRSGILLYGPPGTGKTLIAKAVATECGLCFLSVKGPELLNMYVGQSEQNVREVFEKARDASPCIIFFDELDSLAPNRGASGDSGGVMDRVVSQLLAEMDGLNQTGTVFIIGATNRPDLIDPALLRPGRFDKLLYVGPCIDRDSKIAVLTALTRKFTLENDSLIAEAVDLCPENFSGADFYGVCSSAWMAAVRRFVKTLEEGKNDRNSATASDVIVTLDDFKLAIKTIKPSIRQEDLEYYNKLKSDFK